MRKGWKGMRRVGAVVAMVVVATASCTIPYKLKAKKWGEEIQKAVSLLQEVGSSVTDPMVTQQKEWKDTNMPKLEKAKEHLNNVKFAMEGVNPPGSLSDAHNDLKTGVEKMISAITALQDAITFGNRAKFQEFQQLKNESEQALLRAKKKLTGEK